MIKRKKKVGGLVYALSAAAIATVMAASTALSVATMAVNADSTDGKYYTDYTSAADAKTAAEELTEELASEGDVLLKNQDDALPMKGNEWVSVFGVTSDALIGASDSSGAWAGSSEGSDTVADALSSAGFKVNPTLKSFYAGDESDLGNERLDFTGSAASSLKIYDDAAVIVLSREGGEGSDAERITSETVDEDDDHLALYNDGTNTYKHYLMLTDSEEELIEYVTERFEKVIVLTNTSNIMEIEDLQNNDAISAIVHIGRPGVGGLDGLASILTGEISPSGGLVDEWMTDFTTDPTWYNFGDNGQTSGYTTGDSTGAGSNTYYHEDGYVTGTSGYSTEYESEGYHGVDYEESIYLGYKYYETYYYDMYNAATTDEGREEAQEWWEDNVLYPFGYGLSYTTFSFNIDGSIYTNESCTDSLGSSVSSSKFNSSADSVAEVKTLYVPVTVTNTGDVAGKKIVQAYVTAPYTTGGIEKASATMVGYAKSDLLDPGESETVIVSFNVQDMASWDYDDANEDGYKGDYELDSGDYTVRIMEDSHFDCATDLADTEDAYDEVSFYLEETAHLQLDDYSDNELSNLFSEENGVSDKDTEVDDTNFNNIRTADYMADGESGMSLMTRADMDGTFPVAPTKNDLTFNNSVLANWAYWDNFRVTDNPEIDSSTGLEISGTNTWDASYDQEDYPWYKTADDIPDGWTQAEGTYDEDNKEYMSSTEIDFPMYVSSEDEDTIKYWEMVGVDWDDDLWDEFLNQLTYDELCSVIEFNGYSSAPIESVGKVTTIDADGPNNYNSVHCWCSEDIIASTWNVDLAEKEGTIMGNIVLLDGGTGWYGPGADIHRSPFSGRNNEYYSQDGIQGGYIAAAVIQGAEDKGVICYVKHCFMNDQETNRGNLFTWADEQAIRENYCKVFQMALQEGGSSAGMVAYGRLGGWSNTGNYNMNTELYQNQWGVHAYFVTDGYIGWADRTDPDMMVRAGNVTELYTQPYVEYLSGEWDAEKQTVMVGGEADGGLTIESPTQWYSVRTTAKALLYQVANSAGQQNGYSEIESLIDSGALSEGTIGVSYSDSVSIASLLDDESVAVYSISDGTLPSGLELDEESGEISGTPTVSGTYSFTVAYVIDGYIEKEADFTITIDEALYLDEDSDDLTALTVGEEFMALITSDVFTTSTGQYTSVTYAVADGSTLPDGVYLEEDGTIYGTPTTAGTYTVTIVMTAEEQSSSSDDSSGTTTTSDPVTVEYTITFIITGDAEEEVDETAALIEELQTSVSELEEQIADLEAEVEALSSASSGTETSSESTDDSSDTDSGCGSVISATGIAAAVSVIAVCAAAVIVCGRKGKKE